jgi:hypothetical protein
MTDPALHQHILGEPWTDEQIEQMIKGLLERDEADAVDAIIWLRFELAQAKRSGRRQPKRSKG